MVISSKVEKNGRGWSVQTVSQWAGSERRFITNSPAGTLRFAIFKALALTMDTPLGSMSKDEAVLWLKRHFDEDFHWVIDNHVEKVLGN